MMRQLKDTETKRRHDHGALFKHLLSARTHRTVWDSNDVKKHRKEKVRSNKS